MVQSVLHICLFIITCLSAWTIGTWAESDAKKWIYIRLSIKSLFNNRVGSGTLDLLSIYYLICKSLVLDKRCRRADMAVSTIAMLVFS